MVQARLRRQVFNASCEASDDFTPSFGEAPVTQAFGDVAAEGSSTNIARADHRHGMPSLDSFVLDLETSTMYLNELMTLLNSSNIQIVGSGITFGGRDDTGHLGGFGTVEVSTSGASATSGVSIMVMQSTSGVTTQALHPWKRTQVFQTRVRPVLTTAMLASCFCAIGGLRTTATGRADQVQDGVYFYLATDVTGAGNWFAAASTGGVTTTVDTGRAPVQTGGNVEFQNFRINYDIDTNTATFAIGDSTHVDADGNVVMDEVATITTNIPTSANKLAGFGVITTNATALLRTPVADYFALTGFRQYSE